MPILRAPYRLLCSIVAVAVLGNGAAQAVPLGSAQAYNGFFLGDFTSSGSDTEGRLAAGGDVTLTNYAVGLREPTPVSGSVLVVGGDLSATATVVNNGPAEVAGTARVDASFVAPGGLTSSLGAAGLSVDFAQAERELSALSLGLAQEQATGAAVGQYGGVYLTGDGVSAVQIFDVGTLLSGSVTHLNITSVPANATIVINAAGAVGQLVNMGLTGLSTQRTLFNFYEATSLVLGGVGLFASVLAPEAAITGNNAQLNGTIIGASWQGNAQLNYAPFLGELETYPVPTPTPTPPGVVAAPGTLGLFFTALIGLVGRRSRAHPRRGGASARQLPVLSRAQ